MNEAAQGFRILLVVETVEEANDVGHILKKEFSQSITTAFRHEAVSYYTKLRPDLLIVSCNEVTAAEEVVDLIKSGITSEQHPYILLLCKTSESREAYEIMLKGVVDSFVADRPLYDPYSVIAAVAFGLNHVHKQRRLNTEFKHLNKCITGIFDSGDEELKSSLKEFMSFSKGLSAELDILKGDFRNGSNADGKVDFRYVSERLTDFNNQKVLPQKKNLDSKLQQHQNWFHDAKEDYSDRISQINIQPRGAENIQILLIDDDDFYREAVVTMLEEANVTIEGVEDGTAALQYLKESMPDVILLDYEMPELNGLELLQELKANQVIKDIPVIMLTGFHTREIVQNSISHGASGFIVKPGSPTIILEKIQSCISKEIIEGN